MNKSGKLTEGMSFGDLRGLVSNDVSVDQFKPKIGNPSETVVIGIKIITFIE